MLQWPLMIKFHLTFAQYLLAYLVKKKSMDPREQGLSPGLVSCMGYDVQQAS